MKKSFVFFTAALFAVCLFASCSKTKEAAGLPPEKQTHLTIYNETGETKEGCRWLNEAESVSITKKDAKPENFREKVRIIFGL